MYRRVGMYSANIHCLLAAIIPKFEGTLLASTSPDMRRIKWRDVATLWQACLTPEEWEALVECLSVGWEEDRQALTLVSWLDEDPAAAPMLGVNRHSAVGKLAREVALMSPRAQPFESEGWFVIRTLAEIERRAPRSFDTFTLPEVEAGENLRESLRLHDLSEFDAAGTWLTRLCLGGDWTSSKERMRVTAEFLLRFGISRLKMVFFRNWPDSCRSILLASQGRTLASCSDGCGQWPKTARSVRSVGSTSSGRRSASPSWMATRMRQSWGSWPQ